ncbi:MAG: peptide chain release factor 1 [Chloroflexi bacterium]|nr:peptide chain release factor 1 [Chloroflexota bacterium]
MLDKLRKIEKRYEEVEQELLHVGDDYKKAAALAKERAELEPIVEKARAYRRALEQRDEAKDILEESDDAELRELAKMELDDLDEQIEALEREIKRLLLPRDPRDERNVIMEIRAGAGGEEAALFAADLFRMYSRYAERQGWKVEVLSANTTGLDGYKEIIFRIQGKGAYSRLKYESGVHRVQRVPVTESQGRIHTSTATVAVLAEADEVDIQIPEKDIKIEVFKAGGAGGQHVQKNATAVRITHLPTGIVVQCQDERSQYQNKLRALSILRARLYEIEERKRREQMEAERRAQVGTGERSEKIRTYNFPQSRVTDHRIHMSLYNLSSILDGELDTFIDELTLRDEAERLAALDREHETTSSDRADD